jgi:DNA polymerase I
LPDNWSWAGSSREGAQAVAPTRAAKRALVLARLLRGPARTVELSGLPYGTEGCKRARELRDHGWRLHVLRVAADSDQFEYTLTRLADIPAREPREPRRPVVPQKIPFAPETVTWVLSSGDLGHLLVAIAATDEVVWDLETTGLREWAWTGGPLNGGVAGRVVLSSMTLPTAGDGGRPTTWIVPLSHPDSPWCTQWPAVLEKLARAVADGQKPCVNQNLKFDLRWVHRHGRGVDLSHHVSWDTQVSSHLLDETTSTSLKERAPATFEGLTRWDDFDLSVPGAAERVPLIDLGLYAARDTYWTWRLAQHHRERMFLGSWAEPGPEGAEEVEEARLGRLATWCAMPTVATLTAIEQRGMLLDRPWVQQELTTNLETVGKLGEELCQRYGFTSEGASFAPTSNWFIAWAELAVANEDLRIAELTPTGKPRWSKGVLKRQSRAGSKVAAQLLELRSAGKRAEYLASWLEHADTDDVIHSTYNSGKVVTGRLSSDSPNMQQVTAALKPAFIPRPGNVFIDLDYGQIELRIAAFVSRCEPMLEALRNGDDLHRLLAARITGKDPLDVLPSERHGGKSANFGLLYGMSASGFRDYADDVYGVSWSPEQATAIRSLFFETWVGLADWHARMVNEAHRIGQVTSPIGRVRRLPDIWDGNDYLVAASERIAVNAPVQGFASDVMQMAAASIEGTLPGHDPVERALLVGTVHDSILVESPLDGCLDVARACQARMVGITEVLARLDCDFDVPLVADVKIGSRWGLDDLGHLG